MNKEAVGFPYFVKTCTFEQISILRTAVSGLEELGIKALPKNAFNEGIITYVIIQHLKYQEMTMIRDFWTPKKKLFLR